MTALTHYTKKFVHYLRHNRAVSALEYAILVGVIAVAIAVALNSFSSDIKAGMDAIGGKVKNPTTKALPVNP